MEYPKISIVTPSFNQGQYLEETIGSIINQKYPNLEYIVIDGGSTDNSVEIIKKYEKHLSYWVSEKDNGQSDAINKGINRITGDVFNWINSDDLLEEGALLKIGEAYRKNPEKKVFCFGLHVLTGGKKEKFKAQNNPDDRVQCFCNPVIAQPATFFSADAVKKMGRLNPELHYSMDYEWWLKLMFLYGNRCIFTSTETIASFRVHKEAKTSKGNTNFMNDMAGMLYSLSGKARLQQYRDIFNAVFEINKKYDFDIFPENTDAGIVERMMVYFLLKWKSSIYTKKDFLSSKMILEKIKFQQFELTHQELLWLNTLKKNARVSSWLEFRAKRKIRHLFSK